MHPSCPDIEPHWLFLSEDLPHATPPPTRQHLRVSQLSKHQSKGPTPGFTWPTAPALRGCREKVGNHPPRSMPPSAHFTSPSHSQTTLNMSSRSPCSRTTHVFTWTHFYLNFFIENATTIRRIPVPRVINKKVANKNIPLKWNGAIKVWKLFPLSPRPAP